MRIVATSVYRMKRILFLFLNNPLINWCWILMGCDVFIKRYINNWSKVKYDKNKSSQENVGFSHKEHVQQAIEKTHEQVRHVRDTLAKKSGRVLDVGCGTGLYLQEFEEGFVPVGVDLNSSFLEKAKSLVKGGTFYKGVITDVPEKPGFDLILSISVIEYISPSSLEEFFKQVYLRLNEGGIMVIQYPHALTMCDLMFADLSYVSYSPERIEDTIAPWFEVISHKHSYDGREIVKRDPLRYDPEMGKSFRNGYMLVAKKEMSEDLLERR